MFFQLTTIRYWFARQDEQKVIIPVFRATVFIQVYSIRFYRYGYPLRSSSVSCDRHSRFAKLAESGPLLAITNWACRGWKIIFTGHSRGGAISQLLTTQVISKLVELAGYLRWSHCAASPLEHLDADHHFWSSYTEWYNVYDAYIYGHVIIFRLATFGVNVIKEVILAFRGHLQKLEIRLCAEVIGYRNEDLESILVKASDEIHNISHDLLIPIYLIFGCHHFIRKDEKSELIIDSFQC
ncbi:unnamed protein product [Didymodactylos carnosus]|uniref:Fungal lipase-like domain-containing protein n=1 Tax=Didymodactylos carnosus TaxID=1234261 RepID=A0A814ZHL2_9BILA|nr:unnamed protein product [Didymodactylos carnosus]CAF1244209.1 unnamed protein product [Didymodactylos carnosus]CAF3813003.1 unnamed protein product [Didymodactylos carnosus]CAF4008976.1 unnamed protein product [Didymodactylos carnosus]